MIKKSLVSVALCSTALLSACDSSSISGGTDQMATHCLAFAQAVKVGGQFKHTVHNTCDQTIHVLAADSQQRFSIVPRGMAVLNLASASPNMGACFDPYTPEVSSENQFKCEKV